MTKKETTANEDWHDSFFEGLMAEFWLEAVPEEVTQSEVDFIAETCGTRSGAHCLDLACGAGRHAIPLALGGAHVLGIDTSQYLLAVARERAGQATVKFVERDVRDIKDLGPFDAAWFLGNGYGYLNHDGNRAVLEALAGCLKAEAPFLLESSSITELILSKLGSLESHETSESHEIGHWKFNATRRLDADAGYMYSRYQVERDGESETANARQAIYSAEQLVEIGRDAGLELAALYGGYDGAPFGPESDHWLGVFKRAE